VGRLAAYGHVNSCSSVGEVIGDNSVGGIAGSNNGVTLIQNCFTTSPVNGNRYVGGVTGRITYNSSVLKCYATGPISGNSYVGGVAGDSSNGWVTNCVALNSNITRTSGLEVTFGRVAGMGVSGTVENSLAWSGMLALGGISFGTAIIDGESITTQKAKTKQTYVDAPFGAANFVLDWKFGDTDTEPWKWGGDAYPLPLLFWQTSPPLAQLPAHLR
jgi:hypothetical protein